MNTFVRSRLLVGKPCSQLVALIIAAVSLVAEVVAEPGNSDVLANATNSFSVKGLTCDDCARSVGLKLMEVSGVASADVSFSNKLAVVGFDTNRVSSDALRKAISRAGYSAKLIKAANSKLR